MNNSILPGSQDKSQISKSVFSELHILIPFQPSMWDRNKVEKIMRSVISKAENMLAKSAISPAVKKGVMTALKKSLNSLDLTTLRKTAFISISDKGSETLYLSGKTKKNLFINRPVKLADLATEDNTSPAFFFLNLGRERTVLYEYHRHVLNTITERKNTHDFRHFNQIDGFLNILQQFQPHPVFITGVPEFVLAYKVQTKIQDLLIDFHQNDDFEGNIKAATLTHEISADWKNWNQKFYAGLLKFGNKSSLVNYGIEKINSNIANCKRGIIFLEKEYSKKENYTSDKERTEFYKKVYKFLSDGNCIILVDNKELRKSGGIALFKYPGKHLNVPLPIKEEKILL